MDSTLVNWESLDSLVIEFAKSENLFEDSIPITSPSSSLTSSTTVTALTTMEASSSACISSFSSSAYQSRLLIRQIRSFIESGDVDGAIDQLGLHAPEVLEDNRILFRLQKQVIIIKNWISIWSSCSCGLGNDDVFVVLWLEIRWTFEKRDGWWFRGCYAMFKGVSCTCCPPCVPGNDQYYCFFRVYRRKNLLFFTSVSIYRGLCCTVQCGFRWLVLRLVSTNLRCILFFYRELYLNVMVRSSNNSVITVVLKKKLLSFLF